MRSYKGARVDDPPRGIAIFGIKRARGEYISSSAGLYYTLLVIMESLPPRAH